MAFLKRHPWLVLVAVLLAITFAFFGKILVSPSSFLFATLGDTLKSYYCTLFYVKYNQGLQFTGLNYPFGESLWFTDGQPLLAETLRVLHQQFGMPARYTIGVINTLIILSLPLAGVVVYKLLRLHRLPAFYAIAVAAAITFMSPQIYRFNAHMSLSHVFFVPVVWYLIIRIFRRTSWLWLLWYVLFALAFAGIHAYLVVIAAMFLLSYVLVYVLQRRKFFRRDWPFLLSVVVAAVLPMLLFNGFVSASDKVTDRPNNPFGFFEYYATPGTVFNPVEGWQQMNGIWSSHWEGFAYVGMVAMCVAVLTLVRLFKKGRRGFLKKRWRGLSSVFRFALPGQLRIAFWAAVLMLLFSFCLPFRIEGFHLIPELIPPLKQFRSLGRFAWIFYYVFTVYAAVYLYLVYRYLSRKGLRQFGASLLAMALLVWCIEAYATISFKAETLRNGDRSAGLLGDTENYNQLLQKANVKPSDFQAVLPLPFVHIGSEKLWIPSSEHALQQAMYASAHTQLPIAGVMLSRTSLSQTLELIDLVSNPLLPKPILEKLPSAKPFLLIVTPDSVSEYEERLIGLSKQIYSSKELKLYSLPVAALQNTAREELLHFAIGKSYYYSPAEDVFFTQRRDDVVIESYPNGNGEHSFMDAGSTYARKGPFTIFSGVVPNASDTTEYELSVWLHMSWVNAPALLVKEYNAAGNLVAEQQVEVKETVDVANNWARARGFFRLKNARNRIEVTVVHARNITADNLMIRPRSCDVYTVAPQFGLLVKNNVPMLPSNTNKVAL